MRGATVSLEGQRKSNRCGDELGDKWKGQYVLIMAPGFK